MEGWGARKEKRERETDGQRDSNCVSKSKK